MAEISFAGLAKVGVNVFKVDTNPAWLEAKVVKRVQKLEQGFEVGIAGLKKISGEDFVTIEGLWTGGSIDVFIPKNCASLKSDQPTAIISGACMFGGNWGLEILMESGKQVSLTSPKSLTSAISVNDSAAQVLVDDKIHPAEAENLYRLVDGLAFFANHQQNRLGLEVWFHIPYLEYMLHALDLVDQEVLSLKQYGQVVEAVAARFEKLKSLYQKRLPPSINCQFISPLDGLKEAIVSADRGVIAANFDSPQYQPKNFSDIAFLSYSLAYWQLNEYTKSARLNAIALETFEEVKIFAEAKKLGQPAGAQLEILPVYLAPKVRGPKGEDLFWMDKPNQLLPVLKGIKSAYVAK